MRQDRNYSRGKTIFKDVQMADSHDSNFKENHMIGPINKRHLHKIAHDEQRTSGLADSPKPPKHDIQKHTASANSSIMSRNMQRNPIHHAPYSEIYNMVVMRETY